MTFSVKRSMFFFAKSNCYNSLIKSISFVILNIKLMLFSQSNNLNKVCTKHIKINDISKYLLE